MGKIRVLLIEDEATIRELMSIVGKDLGYEMQVASNALDGIAIWHKNSEQIDIILMDMMMPGMCGDEATRIIKAESPNTKVVVLSGTPWKAEGCGADEVMSKPFKPSVLQETIARIVGNSVPCPFS